MYRLYTLEIWILAFCDVTEEYCPQLSKVRYARVRLVILENKSPERLVHKIIVDDWK